MKRLGGNLAVLVFSLALTGCTLVSVRSPTGTCRTALLWKFGDATVTCCEPGTDSCTTVTTSEPTHVSAVLTAIGTVLGIVLPLVVML